MKPGTARRRSRSEPSTLHQSVKCPLDVRVPQPSPCDRDEHGGGTCGGARPVAIPEIALQGVDRARMHRQLARLTEFGHPNGDDALSDIDILAVECDGLPDAH